MKMIKMISLIIPQKAWSKKIENILDSRLADLTPKDIKDIIQRMIKEHLGWLVVWGGFFGGLLGFILSPVALNLI